MHGTTIHQHVTGNDTTGWRFELQTNYTSGVIAVSTHYYRAHFIININIFINICWLAYDTETIRNEGSPTWGPNCEKAGASSSYLTAWHAWKRPADSPAPRPATADLHKLLEIGSKWHFIWQLLPNWYTFHGFFGPLTPSPDCARIVCDWIFEIPTASRLSFTGSVCFYLFSKKCILFHFMWRRTLLIYICLVPWYQ